MGEPKISVIVPVYGVEAYMEQCARSLMEQTLDDMEFVFVDDATTDLSMAVLERVLDDYPERREQVVIVHHETNLGLPAARRTGIEHAKGEYIAHVDSDDWIDSTMLATLYEEAERQQADIAVCDWVEADGMTRKRNEGCYKGDVRVFFENMLLNKHIWSVCNKIVKRSLYDNDIVYPRWGMGEDLVLCTQLVMRTKRIAYVAQPLYYYRVNKESMSRMKTLDVCVKQFEQVSENVQIVLRMLDPERLSLRGQGGRLYLQYHALTVLYPLVGIEQYYRLFRDYYPSFGRTLISNPYIGWEIKVRYVATLLHWYPLPKYRVKA